MSLEALRASIPDYAKDIRLNLGSLAAEPALTPQQRAPARSSPRRSPRAIRA